MADVLLGTPKAWSEQMLSVPLDELVLSYYPKTWPPYPSTGDVAEDLAAGAWLARVPSSRDEIFRLGGTRFTLRVKRRRGRGDGTVAGPWIAHVLDVEDTDAVPRKARIFPQTVDFDPLWREAPCDLADVLELVRQRERQWRESRRRGASPQAEVRAHKRLQDEVRRQYGELETLVTVLEQRPEQPEDSLVGRVRPEAGRSWKGRPSIVVDPTGGAPAGFRGKRVQLRRADGTSYNTRVTLVRAGRLEISQPRGWTGAPDQEVQVSVVRPFGMRQNAEALQRFKAAEVEGSWEDLARLLCRPGDLALPDHPPPLRTFYCDDDPEVPSLNDEQRAAVTGAVTSPHAFLIQGPPGTGKTEVISETIRQLVGRGERVLLLAPAHVAVDEALGRVGRKPGVRPLRITWDDERVDDELRAFLPEQVGVELARTVLRPTDHGQVARWTREREAVDARLAAITRLREVVRRRTTAVPAVPGAERAAVEAAETLRSRVAGAEAEMAALTRALSDLERTLAGTDEAVRTARAAEQRDRAELSASLTELHARAADLVTSGEAVAGTIREAGSAHAERDAWGPAHDAQLEPVVQEWRATHQAVADAREQIDAADRAVSSHRAALSDAVLRQSAAGRVAERIGFGRVAGARAAVAEAETAARQHRATWEHWEAVRQDVARRYQQLQQASHRTREALEQRLAAATAAGEAAGQRFDADVRRFGSAVAAAGGAPARLGLSTAAEWTRVARAVRDGLAVVVRSPAEHPPEFPSIGGLESIADRLERLRRRSAQRIVREHELASIARRRDEHDQRLRQARASAATDIERLTAAREAADQALATRRETLATLDAERERLLAEVRFDDLAAGETLLHRRRHVLAHLPALDARWRELTAERDDEQLVDDIQQSLIRATNLVCATTKGIVGRGSDIVRDVDYDTLIVDEASRVTESEFLIGAVRARRWILVGDERQLPPHVDQDDEHFLHALTALHRTGRGGAATLEQGVDDLAGVWGEDEAERKFRRESVLAVATELESTGAWRSTFRDQFASAHRYFATDDIEDAAVDRRILRAMRRYLVQSLFELAVKDCHPSLRQPLVIQRRMIAPLATIVREPVYGGRYESPPEVELAAVGVTPLVVSDTFDRPATFIDTSRYDDAAEEQVHHGFVNKREQEFIVRACELYDSQLRSPVTVSVLSFYRAQARALERRLLGMRLPMLQWEVIDVVDRIQGQQSDLVLLSFTRAKPGRVSDRYGQWLQDLRRLNVACTRARRALVLVGHGRTLRQLRTDDNARGFYTNLLGLFDTDRRNFKRIHQFD